MLFTPYYVEKNKTSVKESVLFIRSCYSTHMVFSQVEAAKDAGMEDVSWDLAW